jgi:chitinase
MIPVESFTQLMGDFSLVTGIIFMQYEQFMRGEVVRKNDSKALKLFMDYIQAKLVEQGGDGHLIRESAQRVKKDDNDEE